MNWGVKSGKLLATFLAIFMVAITVGSTLPANASVTTGNEAGIRIQSTAITYPFSDNVEVLETNYWVADSPWARTTIDSHSGSTSWTDSPGNYYQNGANISLTLASPIDLSSAVKPALKFWHHYQLEAGFDFGYVEISTNGGTTWTELAAYSGTQTSPYRTTASLEKSTSELLSWQEEFTRGVLGEPWVMEQIDLTAYATQSNVKIRFRLLTDGSGVRDGWYIDDIAIDAFPTAVNLSAIVSPTRTSLNLSWSQNVDAGFSSYAVYRGLSPGVSFRDTLVTMISNQNTTSFIDASLAAKTTYFYKVFVVSNSEIYTPSNEQSGTTLSGLNYPFSDDMEAGSNNWVAEPSNVWTLVTPDLAHSGSKAWTESPSGNYTNNLNASLALSDSLEINSLSQLVFWHRLAIASGDNASVELSTDNGNTWTTLAIFTNLQISSWTRVQLPLGVSSAGARVRFRISTDSSGTAGGWYIDDVSISDLPAAVTLNNPVPQPPPNIDRILLTWTQNNDAYFSSYRIYRDTNASVDLADTLVTTINSQTSTNYTDFGLPANATYYYRVYVVNPLQVYNGSNTQNATTLAQGGMIGYPFFDNMESGVGNWVVQSPWGLTNEAAHSGNFSWTDSPNLAYGNSVDASIRLTINLSGAIMPMLDFWQKYSLEENKDFGFIDVSINKGTSWSRIYFITGGSGDWVNARVDLAQYAGQAELWLRFRFVTDSTGTSDGWYIDDVKIAETSGGIPYPFFDNMESGPGNWLPGSWGLVSPGHNSTYTWTDSTRGSYLLDNWMELVLTNVIDLTSASHPQLTFWHKYDLANFSEYGHEEHDYGRVYVSTYYGQSGSWQQVAQFTGSQSQWTQVQIDLSSYAGLSTVRIKFVLDDGRDTNGTYGEDNRQYDGWYIDDINIQNGPADVTLAQPTNVTMHGAAVNWTQNTDGNFARYEIYRNKSAAVSRSSTLIATITAQTTTSFADNYTVLQPDSYRYRMWVVDQSGRYSLGSNEVVATYSVPQVSYPFFDNMESGTANWEWSVPWGQTNAFAYSGNTSWTDSPLGAYENNASTALATKVNLSAAGSPMLNFWHRHALEENKDYGYVEVSTNGGNTWTQIFSVTGNGEWNLERINLKAYAGGVIGLRFRLASDASGVADGWYIDDVSIDEGATGVAYPFFDNMENGLGSWSYTSPWGQTTALSHSANTSWTDSPFGSYANSSDASLWTTIDLSAAVMPVLYFWQKYSLEENKDFAFVEVSTNKGTSWSRIYFVTGGSPDWVNAMIDLTQYAGQAEVMLRFRLVSDSSGTSDGWFIDDISIKETTVGGIPYPFFDFMEGGPGNWLSSSWALVSPGYSPSFTWTDSPRGSYLLDNWMELVLGNVIDLRGAKNPQLTFWHKYDLANFSEYGHEEHDYGRVYVSNYYGQSGSWQQVASFTGTQAEWKLIQVDLSNYAGLSSVRIKFVLDDGRDTNGTYGEDNRQYDGWYIDDVRLLDAPTDVAMAQPTGVTMHGATVNWTQNNDGNFAQYEIYRNKSAAVNRSSTLIATITGQATTGFTDNYTVLQPDSYRYRMWVVDQLGRYSLGSNEVTATYTVPQVSYPFFDNMENGTANWEWSVPWGQTNAFAYSGNTSWADSPAGVYDNNANTALTTYVNMSTAGSPILTFWHRHALEENKDYGYVEVSTNGGNTWTQIFAVTGSGDWNQERIALTTYAGSVIGLRFRLASDAAGTADGWYIDDVSIADGATSVGFPFSDNVDSGLGSWFYNSPWGQTTALAHSGNVSWTDSPFGSYANSADTSLRITVNLAAAVMPVLDFWQRYSLEENKDFGFIELSKDRGASWSRVYFVTGGSPDWLSEQVDLTGFAGQAEVMLRFRLVTDASGTADGWYIDDINIRETTVSISYPFLDNMDNPANWLSSSWELVTPGYSPIYAWTDSPRGAYLLDNWMELVLGNVLDLRGAKKPQLIFWHKYDLANFSEYGHEQHDYGRVYVSNYYGQSGSWQQLAQYTGSQGTWTKVQIDLSAYAGISSVRIKFVLDDNRDTNGTYGEDNRQYDGWYIDNVRIADLDTTPPGAITNLALNDVTKNSVTLGWTARGNDENNGTAVQYDLRYLIGTPITEANWATANQVANEPAPLPSGSIQSFMVGGLTPATNYYFAMKAADEVPSWSALSNVIGVTTLEDGGTRVWVDAPRFALVNKDFTANIRISGVVNFDATNYDISFNSTALRVDNVTAGLLNGVEIPVSNWNEYSPGKIAVVQNVGGTPGVSGTGYLARVYFHAFSSEGATPISTQNGTLSDNLSQPIPTNWIADSVQIVSVLPGDANGDEMVDAVDVTKLERIIVKLDGATPGADINGDGSVNALDVTFLELRIVGLK